MDVENLTSNNINNILEKCIPKRIQKSNVLIFGADNFGEDYNRISKDIPLYFGLSFIDEYLHKWFGKEFDWNINLHEMIDKIMKLRNNEKFDIILFDRGTLHHFTHYEIINYFKLIDISNILLSETGSLIVGPFNQIRNLEYDDKYYDNNLEALQNIFSDSFQNDSIKFIDVTLLYPNIFKETYLTDLYMVLKPLSKSQKFNYIIDNYFIPTIESKINDFDYSKLNNDSFYPTAFLYDVIQKYNLFQEINIQNPVSKYYKLGILNESNILLTVSKTAFEIRFVNDDYDIYNINSNYFGISRDVTKQMYMYGLKSNGNGSSPNGSSMNKTIMKIGELLKISRIYISDSASVYCYWNNTININHFSILRILSGKKTFYESTMNGYFYNKQLAEDEKQILIDSISLNDKNYVKSYINKSDQENQNCDKLNNIIIKCLKLLPSQPNIFKYVATPYIK